MGSLIDKLRAGYDQVMGSIINFRDLWLQRAGEKRAEIFIGIGIFFVGFIFGGVAV